MIADSFGHYSARTVHDHGSVPRTGQGNPDEARLLCQL